VRASPALQCPFRCALHRAPAKLPLPGRQAISPMRQGTHHEDVAAGDGYLAGRELDAHFAVRLCGGPVAGSRKEVDRQARRHRHNCARQVAREHEGARQRLRMGRNGQGWRRVDGTQMLCPLTGRRSLRV